MKRLALRFVSSRWILLAGMVAVTAGPVSQAYACPFCSAVSQTFAEEIGSMDVVAFGQLTEAVKAEEDENGDIPKSKFLVQQVLKGEAWIKPDDTVEVHFFGTPRAGKVYLLMATDPPELMWGSPLKIEPRGQEYLLQVMTQPEGPERLKFFMQHLEDEDEMLARDAYDEFAKTPYEGIIAVKDSMDRQQLMNWITDRDVPTTRRRLYLTMLGVCGDDSDADQLAKLMQSEQREDRAGLNAMIASYLSLEGSAGLPLIEKLFLRNQEAEYADIYAAIMAIRFHGNEGEVISREQLLPGLRAVLERKDLADLVIPDLARWEDWSVIGRLTELFKDAKKESNWVRVPVVNYLRACPLPEAEATIAELREIDAEAVERANTFFPYAQFQGEKRSSSGDDASEAGESEAGESADGESEEGKLGTEQDLAATGDSAPAESDDAAANILVTENSEDESGLVSSGGLLNAIDSQQGDGRSIWFYVVPILIAIGLVVSSLMSKKKQTVAATTEGR